MSKTILTPQVLRDKGFEEKLMYGHICFVKGKDAVVYSFTWIPFSLENGQPLNTNVYISTWEDLESLIKQ